MWYLFTQMWLWILISFIVGWFSHWYLCCREKGKEAGPATESQDKKIENSGSEQSVEPRPVSLGDEDTISDEWKPQGLTEKPVAEDDLKKIKGIGKVNEKALNELGIFQFSQISAWSEENIKWVEGFLAFPGRISREEWVKQAAALASGQSTEFSQKVDKGEVDYGN